jgi:HK97 family phage prohead protease
MTTFDAPRDDLVRMVGFTPTFTRAKADDGGDDGFLGRATIRFSVFDRWTEIESWFEGNFMESISRGAFRKTMKERRDRIRVLFNHGHDPSTGQKPLGSIAELVEDPDAARGEVDLFAAGYVEELVPALRAGEFGASFMFSVVRDEWNDEPKPSTANPKGLPERTITEVKLYEFGPVTFPAYDDASAGMRSGTDAYLARALADPRVRERLTIRTPDADAAREGTSVDGAALPPDEGTPDAPPTSGTRRVRTSTRVAAALAAAA